MVVRIKIGKSLKGALNYNERKVTEGRAELILAAGFAHDAEDLSFSQKWTRFARLIARNEKVKSNALHISLNFSPEERLDTEKLQNIAFDYMKQIGFGNQPFLVYRHDDAAHPHIHIVTTSIQSNGKAIYLHNLAKRKSEPARKALELEYGLVQAEKQRKQQSFTRTAADLNAAIYGKSATKEAISNIVREITTYYKYTSLEELNAVLRQYNVTAYRGGVGSSQYVNRGLTYSLLDRDGHRIGVPIKASSIYTSPTLDKLEKKFEPNKVKRVPYKKYVQGKLNAVVAKSSSLDMLLRGLHEKNIQCHFERNSKGEINTMYFIDPFNRTIYSEKDLGYSLETILGNLKYKPSRGYSSTERDIPTTPETLEDFKLNISLQIIRGLLANQVSGPDLDPGFTKKKRKKKRPGN